MKRKTPGFLDAVRQKRAARHEQWARGPLPTPVDLATVADFALGSWAVDVQGAKITRGSRELELDEQALLAVVLIHQAGDAGARRDLLSLQLFGPVRPESHPAKLRRITSFLRRSLGDDGSVSLINTPNDGYAFVTGAPVEGRPPLEAYDHDAPMRYTSSVRRQTLGTPIRRRWALGAAAAMVVGLGLVLVYLVERREGVLFGKVVGTHVLAGEPGVQRSPAFSPDGQRIVYSWQKPEGGTHLYVRSVSGGDARALTDAAAQDDHPVWSPNGRLIAFTRREGGRCSVLVIAADGSGSPDTIGDCSFGMAGQMAWVRDSSALTFARRAGWDQPGQIVQAKLADHSLSGVTNPSAGMPGDAQPALATTGRRFSFVRTRALGAEDVQVLEFDSGKPVRMTYDLAPIHGTTFEQGGHALIVSSARQGEDGLWRIRMDGARPERLVPSADPQRQPALSENGRSLAFEHWHLTSRFERIGSGSDAEPSPFRPGVALERSLTLSADGHLAAYVSNLGDHSAVYAARIPDGNPVPITHGTYEQIETAQLSPDGRQIAFAAVRDGHTAVYIVPVTGGTEAKIAGDGDSRAPAWSHDSRTLYYSSNRTGKHWQVYRQRPDGVTEMLTTEGGLGAQESSDGQWLYFVRPDRKGLWQRSTSPGGDDQFLAGELSPGDWRNLCVGRDAVWFVSRPAGDPILTRYVFAKGRVEIGALLPGLLPHSGLTLLPGEREVVMATEREVQVDIEVATLE